MIPAFLSCCLYVDISCIWRYFDLRFFSRFLRNNYLIVSQWLRSMPFQTCCSFIQLLVTFKLMTLFSVLNSVRYFIKWYRYALCLSMFLLSLIIKQKFTTECVSYLRRCVSASSPIRIWVRHHLSRLIYLRSLSHIQTIGGTVWIVRLWALDSTFFVQGGSNMTGTNCDLFTHK
jgi:hypothetical protein